MNEEIDKLQHALERKRSEFSSADFSPTNGTSNLLSSSTTTVQTDFHDFSNASSYSNTTLATTHNVYNTDFGEKNQNFIPDFEEDTIQRDILIANENQSVIGSVPFVYQNPTTISGSADPIWSRSDFEWSARILEQNRKVLYRTYSYSFLNSILDIWTQRI